MTQRLNVRWKAGVATFGLAAFAAAAALGTATPASADMATDDLYIATFVEQNCSGHKFNTDEWGRLVAQIRELDPNTDVVGQQVLFTMESTKAAARKITEFDGCRHQAAADFREVFANDLAPVL